MPITVSRRVLEGITAVRDSGATNMLDRNAVAKVCGDKGFYDAAVWIQENRQEYAEGVIEGFQADDETTETSQKDREDFQKRISSIANLTWQAIGGDVLHTADADSIPRDEVVECVMEHLDQYGDDPDAVAEFKKLSFEEKQAILLKAFPLDRYGW